MTNDKIIYLLEKMSNQLFQIMEQEKQPIQELSSVIWEMAKLQKKQFKFLTAKEPKKAVKDSVPNLRFSNPCDECAFVEHKEYFSGKDTYRCIRYNIMTEYNNTCDDWQIPIDDKKEKDEDE